MYSLARNVYVDTFDAVMDAIKVMIESKSYAKAIEFVNNTIVDNANNVSKQEHGTLLNVRGHIYHNMQDNANAIASFYDSIKMYPSHVAMRNAILIMNNFIEIPNGPLVVDLLVDVLEALKALKETPCDTECALSDEDHDMFVYICSLWSDTYDVPEHIGRVTKYLRNQDLRKFAEGFLCIKSSQTVEDLRNKYMLIQQSLENVLHNDTLITLIRTAHALYNMYNPYQIGVRWIYENECALGCKRALETYYRHVLPMLNERYLPDHPYKNIVPANQPNGKPKIKIGFLSMNLRSHSVGYIFTDIIENLDPNVYEVYIYMLASNFLRDDDVFWKRITACAKKTEILTLGVFDDLKTLAKTISNDYMDILVFTDIGADRFTYFLSFFRMARLQMTWWGHPDSNGTDMDYFVTSHLFGDAKKFYKERLIRVPGMSVVGHNFAKNFVVDPNERLNLPWTNARIYLCVQNIMKLTPHFDPILKGILENDPCSVIVIVKTTIFNQSVGALCDRLLRLLDVYKDRVILLNSMNQELFNQCIHQAHVLLDTFPFGGFMSSLNCFALNKCIIAKYGSTTKSTMTVGLYRQMGFMDLVTHSNEEYVEKAIEVAVNDVYRASCEQKIKDNMHKVFDDKSAVNEWDKVFKELYASLPAL